jgi:hypothetical protein
MDHLDRSIQNGVVVSDEKVSRNVRVAALVMPKNKSVANRISQILHEQGIPAMTVDEGYIPYNIDFKYVMAFSEDDLKNLIFCETAKHENPEVVMIAQCNDELYRKMYHAVGIHKIFDKKVSQHDLAVVLKGEEWKFSNEG